MTATSWRAGVAVTVDAVDLERLVRAYHEWVPDDPDVVAARALHPNDEAAAGVPLASPPDAVIDDYFAHCRCGWEGDEGGHGNHVDYLVRQALAGRIEWP